jgi:putative component of toxin-antitoxin plasmid stabilization module
MNEILFSESFRKRIKKELTNIEQIQLKKHIIKLKSNTKYGKRLFLDYIKELKIRDKRIYFLQDPKINIILLVAISNKKTQQNTIDEIKKDLNSYLEFIYAYKNKD